MMQSKGWPELVGAVKLGKGDYNGTNCLRAWFNNRDVNLKPDDLVIFNIGVNDCIYRKDKLIQYNYVTLLMREAERIDDQESYGHFLEKQELVKRKTPEELFQLFTFEEFEEIMDKIFAKVKGQGIVLSVIGVRPTSEKIGWAVKELIRTNEILERLAKKYDLVYVDLWNHPVECTEDVHPSQEGFREIARLLRPFLRSRGH
jgi:lysophospholipase L1-like esterase